MCIQLSFKLKVYSFHLRLPCFNCVFSVSRYAMHICLIKLSIFVSRCRQLELRPRYCTASVIPPAKAEGEEKEFSPKIQKLVEEIGALTLIEVADLNQLLKVDLCVFWPVILWYICTNVAFSSTKC